MEGKDWRDGEHQRWLAAREKAVSAALYAYDEAARRDVEHANDNLRHVAGATGRKATGRKGFVYLGSPYSLYAGGFDEAARVVSVAAAQLMAGGVPIYCPITHGHTIAKHGELPTTWGFWKAQCQPMIDAAESMIALTMEGWRESVGLTYEIEEFRRTGRLVLHMSPAEVARQAQQRVRQQQRRVA